jgi:tRNA wybutosine-synthesizing protein 3
MAFEKDKNNILSRIDKSKKGSIDKEIKNLVYLINSLKDYYTTSSCSGRIMILKKAESGKKCDVDFFFSSHEEVCFDDVIKKLDRIPKEELWFRQESMIMHIACRKMEDAQKILDIASNAGLKHSGIITTRKKIIVEIIGSEHIDTIIAKNGSLYAAEEHLKLLVDEANKKLELNKKKIKIFYDLIKNLKD